jgi:hypothetical protein
VAEIADNLRFYHAKSHQEKVRTHTSFRYQASTWTHPRKVVARLECSLQPDIGGTTTNGMRQEVDIRYVVTSLKGSAEHLYEDVYCQRGQMENLIKLHKVQMASDRMSCHSATANQVRLILHTAAFWLMLAVRNAIPETDPLAKAEFNTLRERLIKIGARVIEHLARIRIQLPTGCPDALPHHRAWPRAIRVAVVQLGGTGLAQAAASCLQSRQLGTSAFGPLFLNLRAGKMAISSHPIAFMAFSIAVLKRSRRTLTVTIGPSTGISTLGLIRSWFSVSRMIAPLASNSPDSTASITDCTIGLTSSRGKPG